MASELVRVIYCDICLGNTGERVSARVEYVIRVDELTREIAVCSEHETTRLTVAELVQWLGSYGQRPMPEATAPPRRPRADGLYTERTNKESLSGPVECPACGNVFASGASLRPHLRSIHRSTPEATSAAVRAAIAAVSEAPLANPDRPVLCPDCGAETKSGQGLAAHRRRHGWKKALGVGLFDPMPTAKPTKRLRAEASA